MDEIFQIRAGRPVQRAVRFNVRANGDESWVLMRSGMLDECGYVSENCASFHAQMNGLAAFSRVTDVDVLIGTGQGHSSQENRLFVYWTIDRKLWSSDDLGAPVLAVSQAETIPVSITAGNVLGDKTQPLEVRRARLILKDSFYYVPLAHSLVGTEK